MKTLILAALLLSSSLSFASDLKELFSSTFTTHYESARCGDNIMGLLERADQAGVNLYAANILELENAGYSVFGLLNVENAREAGPRNPNFPGTGLRRLPGERNWYHHIVLESEGMIYDYDFGNTPIILPVKEYFEKMFLTEKTREQGGDFYVGREVKLKEYKVVVRPALETLQDTRDRLRLREIKAIPFKDYLGR